MTPPRLSVAEALSRLTALATPVPAETVDLGDAAGRLLRAPVIAGHAQPPFDAAQMDGYALGLRGAAAEPGARYRLIGAGRAGAPTALRLGPGEAARIFTGAPLPQTAEDAAAAIALQEDVTVDHGAADGATQIEVCEASAAGDWIRPSGLDFSPGDTLLPVGRRLTPEDVALAASAGVPTLDVSQRPHAILLPLGDELRRPGERLGPADIYASNQFGVAALLRASGARATLTPPVPDDLDALRSALRRAFDAKPQLIVTLGGASDGDHDLARPAFAAEGMTPDFYKIAMRPGKPLMAGALGAAMVVGLPGNPVSSLVCARIFLTPLIAALEGAAPSTEEARVTLPLARPVGANGPRAHYMRARRLVDAAGQIRVDPFDDQDSSRLSLLSRADLLAVRPPNDGPRAAGELIDVIWLKPR